MQIKDFFTKGSWLMLIPLVGLMYGPLNQDHGQVYTLMTVLDQRIPFNQYFIVPYLTWYVFIFAVPVWFLQKDCRLYFSSIIAITFGLLASFGIYSVFQTTVPRPDLAGNDLFSQLTKALYQMDNPYNAFPSIHVMTSYILFLGCYRTKEYAPKISLLVQGMAMVIILSTLFIKQHTLLDVAGGVFLGGILFKLIGMLTDSSIGSVFYHKLLNTGQDLP